MTAETAQRLPAIVLAGERPGGNALARAHGLPASVLVDVAGLSCIERVFATLRASACVAGGVLVGPAGDVVRASAVLERLLAPGDFSWQAPAAGPSASALAAVARLARYPILITAGDHALLEAVTVDRFCRDALAGAGDFVIGLVPYRLVQARFPDTRRTVLRFRDGTYCGSNLFLLRSEQGTAALRLWQEVESERKRPWRIAARFGTRWLLRYMAGTLSLASALAVLSERSGCQVSSVTIDDPRAAVDVDSSSDLTIAERVLRRE